MAIKTKLILATAALLCLATVTMGTVATTAVMETMTNRLDFQLETFMRQAESAQPDDVSLEGDEPLAYREIAVMTVRKDGAIVESRAAGFEGDPLPLPNLPTPLPEAGEPVTLSSHNGDFQYRVLLSEDPDLIRAMPDLDSHNAGMVAAIPMTEVTQTRDGVLVAMGVTVALVLVVGVTAAWWITRRGLRPVNQMIDAAVAVADGDLNRRLPAGGPRTEIGKLATALNIMVSRLVDAITQRDTEQARLRRFVADASHELRTPLAAIGGYAELYESGGVATGPQLDRAMSRIQGESHRMQTLVEDLLLLARLDQQSLPSLRELDLRQLAYDAVDDARASDPQRAIDVHADAPVVVAADDGQLRQVVVNLLVNARVHTPSGTTIQVAVHRHRNEAVLTVSDDGPGIPTAHRHKVFDRFYRADASRSRDTGGTGLGLSIVKSVTESHGGRVELDTQLGVGTTVRIVLPTTGGATATPE